MALGLLWGYINFLKLEWMGIFITNLALSLFRGIAICWSFTNVIIFLLTFAYMRVFKLDEKTWPGTKITPRYFQLEIY